jgi:hypothetical protein
MKASIIISGQMRTFATCVHTLRWHVFRHYPGADFFISTVKDADVESWKELRKLYPEAKITLDIVDKQPELPEPHEPVRFEPYERSVSVQAVLKQLWQLERGWNLMEQSGVIYDTILRVRPDSFFHSFMPPCHTQPQWAHVPWWGRFGGVNDRFAVLGRDAAPAYFKTHNKIADHMAAGCPLHPESLVAASLSLGGFVTDDTLRAEFSTLKHGENRPPEISPIDFCHAALG